MKSLSAVVVLLLIAARTDAGDDGFVDQSQTGRVTTYRLPAEGAWQSFAPAWTGNLTAIDVLLATYASDSGECQVYKGTFSLYRGRGRSQGSHFDDEQLLLSHATASPMPSAKNCQQWHRVQLHVPVAVQQGQQYSFHLSSPASQNTHTRLGLMVADSYLAGTNNFEAPGYDFSFKTVMREPPPDLDLAEQEPVPASNKRHSASLLTIVLPTVVAGVLGIVLLVVAVTLARRRKLTRTAHLDQEWYTLAEATSEWRRRFQDVMDQALPPPAASRDAFMRAAPLTTNSRLESASTTALFLTDSLAEQLEDGQALDKSVLRQDRDLESASDL